MDYTKKILDQQHQRTVLANGINLLSLTREDVESVSLEIWIKVGSRYESFQENGLAHFIEHMNFKGTTKRTAQQIAEEVDAIGGYLNAFTSRESTVYNAKVLKEHMPFIIELLNDILFNSIYSEEDIEKEKNVVLQELAQTEDSPEEMVMEYFYEASFNDQAFGRSILGTKDRIKSFTRNQVVNFINKYYVGPRIIISAVGNITHEELLKEVNSKFHPKIENKETVINVEKAEFTGGVIQKNDSELSQLHLVIGYNGFSSKDEEYYSQEILSSILGGSISSRLFQEIREKRGLVYSVGTFCTYYNEAGIFGILLSFSAENTQEVITVLSTEIKKIINTIDQKEIDRSFEQIKSSLLMSRESIDNLSSILAGNYFYYGRYVSRSEVWEKYKSVDINKLEKIAKDIFSKNNRMTISVLGDIKSIPPKEQIKELMSI